jgi:alkane 1-monooxygenase
MLYWCRSGKGFWLSLGLPLSAGILFAANKAWIFVGIILVIIPAFDAFLGRGSPLQGAEVEHTTERQIPCWFALCWSMALAIAARKSITVAPLEFIGLVVACGALSATAMAHLHELGHRSGSLWQVISDIAFTVAGYPHYRFAHNLHHAHLGDPRFGSTASMGTSSWKHAGRSYLLALRVSVSSKSYEDRAIPRAVLKNISIALLFVAVPFGLHAWQMSIFFLGYALVSVFIVETVGYMQHYGLDNQSARDVIHSWDVDFWLSNCLLVNNGYHGVHHEQGELPCSRLTPTSAALPGGYFQMLWVSLVPPLWFSVMDRRVAVLTKRRRRQIVAIRNQPSSDVGEVA